MTICIIQSTIELPDVLVELSDTLDVHIAQREFEQAVQLLQEAKEALADLPQDLPQVSEVKVVAGVKEEALVAVLRSELKVTPDKSLQGGPRTARRAVHLLVSLGRSIEARDLLLVHRWDLASNIVTCETTHYSVTTCHRRALSRHIVKNCRVEGSTRLYVQRLGSVSYTHLTLPTKA